MHPQPPIFLCVLMARAVASARPYETAPTLEGIRRAGVYSRRRWILHVGGRKRPPLRSTCWAGIEPVGAWTFAYGEVRRDFAALPQNARQPTARLYILYLICNAGHRPSLSHRPTFTPRASLFTPNSSLLTPPSQLLPIFVPENSLKHYI